jgi:actin-binding protein anillin
MVFGSVGKKREIYLTEMQLLKQGRSKSLLPMGPQGSLSISDIRLPLKQDFMSKIGTAKGEWLSLVNDYYLSM